MSWKFVFNVYGLSIINLEQAATVARNSGYEFFAFNGEVYYISDTNFEKTRITVDDLF